MALTIPMRLTDEDITDSPLLLDRHRNYGDDVRLTTEECTTPMIEAVSAAAGKAGDRGIQRVADAILAARAGKFDKSIPRLAAAPEILLAYFRANLVDGWLYERGADRHLRPWLVTNVDIKSNRDSQSPDQLRISMVANGKNSGHRDEKSAIGTIHSSVYIDAESVTRKKVSDVLESRSLYVETEDLRADYTEALARYHEILEEGFGHQYLLTGQPSSSGRSSWDTPERRDRAKVIHDVKGDEISVPASFAPSVLFEGDHDNADKARKKHAVDDDTADAVAPVPTHFDLRVFDLATHDFLWVNTRDVTRYEYDKTLADKIVLPADQRNLLDILTADLKEFTGDVIEGKSTGNVILCKGVPGVGKTLTAEIYSEVIERPLYSIHSGNLGVQADDVRKNLETTFKRARRWDAVLLLDEADVFVLERGNDITQNAIVAEFLRTLEYFDGLMFMTTNRANDIDDAILSRAAAIIDYALPDVEGILEVWQVQCRMQGVRLDDDVLDDIVHGFVKIAPRDVKMLLRLALRVAKGNGMDSPDTDTFARCAMFRGLHFEKGSR